jgi:hypothetical protein
LARTCPGVWDQVKGLGSALCSAMSRGIAAWRSAIEGKLPRLRRRRVSAEKKVSTAFSQEPEVGGDVEHPARMAGKPAQDLGMLVAAIVVEDHVDHLAGRHGALDRAQEAQELLVAVPLHAAAEDVRSSTSRAAIRVVTPLRR